MEEYSDEKYDRMLEGLFRRFPSFQNVGAGAYKPGLGHMLVFDQLAGHPHRKYRTIHVAGTNGKGSVSNMLTAVCAAAGMKAGLYTSPHILDFRERIRLVDGRSVLHEDRMIGRAEYISKEDVWEFVQQWGETFDHLDLSFFEITTMMAFRWFALQDVDVAIIETGLGGRLDSTNIITPELSVITNIGLDHCDMLGNTLAEIAFEKAGIIKPGIPVVVGESSPETDAVFERKVLYTNLSEPDFMGDRGRIMQLLTFADKTEPTLWQDRERILGNMDLQGKYQEKNLRTVLAACDVLSGKGVLPGNGTGFRDGLSVDDEVTESRNPEVARAADSNRNQCRTIRHDSQKIWKYKLEWAIEHTASIMDFHGRWEKLSDEPFVICDIGHNSHGLKYNFAQLEDMMKSGRFDRLTVIYGAMADKDVDEIMRMLPSCAEMVFVTAPGRRAMPAGEIMRKYLDAGGRQENAVCAEDMCSALEMAGALPGGLCGSEALGGTETVADGSRATVSGTGKARHLVYIGGSTYVVAEVVPMYNVLFKTVRV